MALGDGGQTKKKTLPQQERATEEDGGVDGPAGRTFWGDSENYLVNLQDTDTNPHGLFSFFWYSNIPYILSKLILTEPKK